MAKASIRANPQRSQGGFGKVRLFRKFDLRVDGEDDRHLPSWEEAVFQSKEAAAFYKREAARAGRAAHRATLNKQATIRKDQAELLNTLFELDAKQRRELYGQFRDADKVFTDALFFLAQAGDAMASVELADKANFLIHRLHALAKARNRTSAEMLAEFTAWLVGELNALAIRQPKLFEAVAKARYNWPVLKSVHPHLGEDERKIIEALKVGEMWTGILGPKLRWNPKRPACQIAFKLLMHVASHRERFLRHKDELESGVVESPPEWVLNAMKLPLLENKSEVIAKWWAVAANALDEAFPLPEQEPELMKLVTAQSHKKSPVSRIKEKIEEAFYSIAGHRKVDPRHSMKPTR